MKIYTYLLLCLFLISCGPKRSTEKKVSPETDSATADTYQATADTNSDAATSDPLSLEEIKQRYTVLNDKILRGGLDSVSFKYDCNGERSGTVTYFSDKGKLVIIKHNYNEYSHFSAADLYFLSNNNLFFAHFNRMTWSFESGAAAEGATKDDVIEQRFYIARNKPLLCLEKRYVKRSHSRDNPRPENVQSKQVDVESAGPVLKSLGKLIEFKNKADHDCLGK